VTTYWHVAHPSYDDGDLLCRNHLVESNRASRWAWSDAEEGLDGGAVCLFEDTSRGRTEAEWLWSEHPDHHLLRVDLPDDYPITTAEEEGYPAVEWAVPAEYITQVRAGYVKGVVTRDGDSY
jgi:hypothetical protein